MVLTPEDSSEQVRFNVFVYSNLKGRPEFFTAVDQLLTDKFLCR